MSPRGMRTCPEHLFLMNINDSDGCNQRRRNSGAVPGVVRSVSHLQGRLIRGLNLRGENRVQGQWLALGHSQHPRASP